MSNQLTNVLQDAGLEKSSSALILERFGQFDAQATEWMNKAKELVVEDETQTDKMKLAREARLALRKIRTDADKTRKELKEDSLRYGKAVQGVYNFLEYRIKPIEDHLQLQEDYVKIKEQERVDALRSNREKLVADLREFVGYGDDLGTMSQVAFDALLKYAQEQRAEQIRFNEEALAAQEAARVRELEEQARIRAENEQLRAENEAKEAALQRERELAAAEQRKAEAAAREEREKVEALARAEREKAAAELRLVAEQLAAKERAEKERIELEQAEAAAKAEAERKADAAPDMAKLNAYLLRIEAVDIPLISDSEMSAILSEFGGKLTVLISETIMKIEKV